MLALQTGLRKAWILVWLRSLLAGVLVWAVLGLAACPGGSLAAKDVKRTPLVTIGWTAWADAEAVSKISQTILERELGVAVKLVMADIEIQYPALAFGDIDVMLMAWLPKLQADFLRQYRNQIINLGPIYTRAGYGWAVPDYVPQDKLGSLEDLQQPGVADAVGRVVVGIDPSAGLMRSSRRALQAYGLADMGYELLENSERAMTMSLARAIQNRQWIVVTAWNPHWKWAQWDLRYLRDPKGIVSGQSRVHALTRPRFDTTAPKGVFGFFSRFFIPVDELQTVLHQVKQTSYTEAVESYIQTHPKRVHYWLTGEID